MNHQSKKQEEKGETKLFRAISTVVINVFIRLKPRNNFLTFLSRFRVSSYSGERPSRPRPVTSEHLFTFQISTRLLSPDNCDDGAVMAAGQGAEEVAKKKKSQLELFRYKVFFTVDSTFFARETAAVWSKCFNFLPNESSAALRLHF